jgi:hypothetical protein
MAAATLLGVTFAVAGLGSPASAEPHADRKYCETANNSWGIEGFSDPVGNPYSRLSEPPVTHNEGFYDSWYELWTGFNHAITYGRAYLKAGDYFSIDSTWDKIYPSGDHLQLNTQGMKGYFGDEFLWKYCETIYEDDGARSNTPYSRAPHDGWYRTELVLGAHRGVRLCVTRPSLSNNAHCVGDGSNSAGWYVDLNDEDPPGSAHPSPIPGGGGSGGGTGGGSGGGSAGAQQTPTVFTMQANTGSLFNRDQNGAWHDMGLGMMRNTSPATSDGAIAFQANTGELFTRPVGGPVLNTHLGMMAGTNPSISGGQIAFQANNSLLHTRNLSTGATTDLRLGLMAGTSPSIAGNTGSWRIAFQANTGNLFYRDSGGATVDTGLGMMRGTSPSITKLTNGNYVIAFQANTSLLFSYVNGIATDLRLGLMTDTSPSIASVGTAWTIAFQANTGFLFTRNSAGSTVDSRYGMMAHTSPSNRGNRILFQANTGSLYYRDGNSAAVDTGYGMMAGTNPGI